MKPTSDKARKHLSDIYTLFSANKKLTSLAREIGWSHNIVVREKCKNDLVREFYVLMTKKMWLGVPLPTTR